jgi:hypothetical protein
MFSLLSHSLSIAKANPAAKSSARVSLAARPEKREYLR